MSLALPCSMLAAAAAAVSLLLAGAGAFDAAVLSAPLLLPTWLWRQPRAQRRRLGRQFAVLLLACFSAAMLLIGNQAWQLATAVPWRGALLAGVYLFALVATFRLANAAIEALLLGCMPRRLATAVLATIAVFVFLPLLFCTLQTHRVALPTPLRSDLPNREIAFTTGDGLTLRGTLLTQPRPSPGVVVCHGLGANRNNFLAHAELAARLGCQVLVFDFRAHGESDGHVTTFGARERLDVEAAITALLQDPHTRGPGVVLLGVSMGAATALLTASRDARVRGVFAESAFADLDGMVRQRLRLLPPPLVAAMATAVRLAARIVPGVAVDDISPLSALQQLPAELPVALLHAGDDRVVPLLCGMQLAAARSLELEVFRGAGHAGCLVAEPRRYERLLRQLLARAFAPRSR